MPFRETVTYCWSMTPVRLMTASLPLMNPPKLAEPSVIATEAPVRGLLNVITMVCAGPCRGSVVGLWLMLGGGISESGRSNVPAAPCVLRDTAETRTVGTEPGAKATERPSMFIPPLPISPTSVAAPVVRLIV
jgi:hypothetical protein